MNLPDLPETVFYVGMFLCAALAIVVAVGLYFALGGGL